jgi:hypothetical protein
MSPLSPIPPNNPAILKSITGKLFRETISPEVMNLRTLTAEMHPESSDEAKQLAKDSIQQATQIIGGREALSWGHGFAKCLVVFAAFFSAVEPDISESQRLRELATQGALGALVTASGKRNKDKQALLKAGVNDLKRRMAGLG